MRNTFYDAFAAVAVLLLVLTNTSPVLAAANQLPTIAVWDETNLRFGKFGNPQTHINILGNVQDPDGFITSLTYRLNNTDPVKLSIGPDGTRLANAGDFNAAIPVNILPDGPSSILFTAVDNSGGTQTKTVAVNYTQGGSSSLPYATSWSAAGGINDQAQILDGLWSKNAGGIQPQVFAYDRLVAIGDTSWKDFEIVVPITVRGFHPNPANPSDAGGVGIVARWKGHVGSGQPPSDWTSLGAYGYYSNRLKALALRRNGSEPITQNFSFQLNKTYLFKLKAETVTQGGRYSFKVWEQGRPEPAWNSSSFTNIVNIVDSSGDLAEGSVMLVAHRVDATFGNITVCPLNQSYSLTVNTSGDGSVGDQPLNTIYPCGNEVKLTAQPNPDWVFTGWSGDISSQSSTIAVNMIRSLAITANFRLAPYKSYLPDFYDEWKGGLIGESGG
jgi:hypothetical protein